MREVSKAIASIVLWSVVVAVAFLVIGQGTTTGIRAVRWYRACEAITPAKEWQHRYETCGEFAMRAATAR